MTDPREWLFVSDLHLSGGSGGARARRALPQFLDEVVAAPGAERRTLVLLGDVFDLTQHPGLSDAAAGLRMAELARANREVMEGLAACLRAGVRLEVVGGNHDVEVSRPAVADALLDALGAPSRHARISFWPWLLHEPGVFYAEHGNQHHDLNRIPTILAARQLPDADMLPAPPLRAWSSHAAGPRLGRYRQLVQCARGTRTHERLVGTTWYRSLVEDEAARQCLSAAALHELASLSPFRFGRSCVLAGARIAGRRLGLVRAGDLLAAQAGAVHAALCRAGSPAPTYVFGHTHRAEQRHLPGRPSATYLNTGTWSDDVRGVGPDREDDHLFPYARVRADRAGVRSESSYWRCA